MRAERKLKKAIMRDGIGTQSDMLEELKRKYPQYVERSDENERNKRRKPALIISLAATAACAAIIVPCAVLLPNRNGNDDHGKILYCTQDEYEAVDVNYTIEQYRQENGLNFLYFDWYEIGEDCTTIGFISKVDSEVLCLSESVFLPQQEEFVQLSITKDIVYLSEFDTTISSCNNEQQVSGHTVKWGTTETEVQCIFEENGYRYFIRVLPGQDENRLFELVGELLEK